jgi:Cu(I)/Ag(I) efflux system membrane fusion protein
MVIPRSAVLFTGKRSIVYVQVPDQDGLTYEGRVVELGGRADEFYTVRSGLAKGERVVVHGAFRIDSAMQIMAKPSMMNQSPSDDQREVETKAVSQGFVESLSPVYNAYLDAQERLASDDYAGFTESIASLDAAVGDVHEHELLGDQLERWRSSKRKLSSHSTISNIDEARVFFEQMSIAVLDLQEVFGHAESETLFTAFCPMAFDFQGAKWIQRGEQINNPYFGSAMLRCGDIQASHEPASQSMNPDEHKGHTDE